MNDDTVGHLLSSVLEGKLYCILQGGEGLPDRLPSDLDIVISPKDLPKLEVALLDVGGAKLVQLLQHETTCYFFVLAQEGNDDVRFVLLDAAKDYRRNGHLWFRADELLEGRRPWNGFWVAAPEVEFRYLLAKKILKASVPGYARKRLEALVRDLGKQADTASEKLLGRRWGPEALTWIRSGDWEAFEERISKLKKVLLLRRLRQDPLSPIRYWIPEVGRMWQRWRHPTGLFVAVLGADGAGKSTLIAHLRKELGGAFRSTATFHLMPGLLRRRGSAGPVTDPHGKSPRSAMVSLLKLIYYSLDYTLGYWLKVRPALARSTLVIFDRYFDDLLVDPLRYRLKTTTAMARLLRRLIPRPDLLLVLDVPEEEALSRKQELPLDEVRRQREGYLALGAELPNAVVLDACLPPEEVARCARDVVLNLLHARYVSRRPMWFPHARQERLGWLIHALEGSPSERQDARSYLHLPLPGHRDYLLPQSSRRAAAAALSLYPAQRVIAKCAKTALNIGLRIGVAQRILPRFSLRLEELKGFVDELFGRQDTLFGVALGSARVHRKPVVQVLSEAGDVLGYIKVAWNKATRRLVQNEIMTLQTLSGRDLPFQVPTVLHTGTLDGRFLCVQSGPLGHTVPAPRGLADTYLGALESLAKLEAQRCPLQEVDLWRQLEERAPQVRNAHWRHVLHQGMYVAQEVWRGRAVPVHLSHGDLTPMNAILVSGGLYLYDWEYASPNAPAGYDMCHFLVQDLWLIERLPPGEVYEGVLTSLASDQTEPYWEHAQAKNPSGLFLLYLLERLAFWASQEPRRFDASKFFAILVQLSTKELDRNGTP
ncbi:MAG: hypothetical protein IIA89_06575 [Chloroflexi bacterium]|nr:hypothetical protein [Chloroflexota bacterium]